MLQKAAENRLIVHCSKDVWHVISMEHDLYLTAPFCSYLKSYLMVSLYSSELCFHVIKPENNIVFRNHCHCCIVAIHTIIDGCCLVCCSDVPEVSLQAQQSNQTTGQKHRTDHSKWFNYFCSHVYPHNPVLDQRHSYVSLKIDVQCLSNLTEVTGITIQ